MAVVERWQQNRELLSTIAILNMPSGPRGVASIERPGDRLSGVHGYKGVPL